MAYRIKASHAEEVKQPYLRNGNQYIEPPHVLCCVSDTRRQFLVTDTGYFGGVQLHAAQAEHRQYSHGEHDNTHAAHPLAEAAP